MDKTRATERIVDVETLTDDSVSVSCPVCHEPYVDAVDSDWTDSGGFVDTRAGGSTTEACPNDCPGEVTIVI